MCIVASPVKAAVIYTYNGPFLTQASGVLTTNDQITGFLVFDNPLPDTGIFLRPFTPTSFSFSVGPHLVASDANGSGLFDLQVLPPPGMIIAWNVSVGSAAGDMTTSDIGSSVLIRGMGGEVIGTGSGANFSQPNPPSWRGPTQVPEPLTSSLVALGFCGFAVRSAVVRRRRARSR
jgi:hypothetical protein